MSVLESKIHISSEKPEVKILTPQFNRVSFYEWEAIRGIMPRELREQMRTLLRYTLVKNFYYGGKERVKITMPELEPVEVEDEELLIRPNSMEVNVLYPVPKEKNVYLRKRPDGVVEELEVVTSE